MLVMITTLVLSLDPTLQTKSMSLLTIPVTCEQALTGGGGEGGGGKKENLQICASKKLKQNADWWILNWCLCHY